MPRTRRSKHPKVRNKAIADIVRQAIAAGWRVTGGGHCHLKCYAPDGETIIVISNTPTANSSMGKLRSEFRRAGLEVT